MMNCAEIAHQPSSSARLPPTSRNAFGNDFPVIVPSPSSRIITGIPSVNSATK